MSLIDLFKKKLLLLLPLLLLISGCVRKSAPDVNTSKQIHQIEMEKLCRKILAAIDAEEKAKRVQTQVPIVPPSNHAKTKSNASYSSGYSGTSNVTGYGKTSKTTGRVRNNVVSGYYRRNGTYVKSYARS